MWLHEFVLTYIVDFLVDDISEISILQLTAWILFSQSTQILFDFGLSVLSLFQLIIVSLLYAINIRTEDRQWFVLHLESKVIPIKVLQILLYSLGYVSSLSTEIDI